MADKIHMVAYNTRIEQSLSDKLKEYSTASEISITKIINKALEEYLNNIELKK